MKREKLSLETLRVDSFETTAARPELGAAPTNRCETRLTICTVPPLE